MYFSILYLNSLRAFTRSQQLFVDTLAQNIDGKLSVAATLRCSLLRIVVDNFVGVRRRYRDLHLWEIS